MPQEDTTRQDGNTDGANGQTFDVNVDGKMRTFTLEELKTAASAGTASTQRFQEAARLRKEAEQALVLHEAVKVYREKPWNKATVWTNTRGAK